MKRKIAAILVVSLLAMSVTACGTDERNSDEVKTEQQENGTNANEDNGMVHLDSAQSVDEFLKEVYAGVSQDLLPMGIESMEQDLTDVETVQYTSGLTDLSQVDGITVSESMIGSIAYSLVYVRTKDGADADAIRQQMMENINPAKWICVQAEKQLAVKLGDDVLYVMGHPDTVAAVYEQVVKVATDKGMAVSETVEKDNQL